MMKWSILFTICLSWSLPWLDFTTVNIALPAIATQYHLDLMSLQWIMTAYIIFAAVFMMVSHALSERFGPWQMLIVGIGLFTIASTGALFSSHYSTFILSRIGQGIGIAFIISVTMILLNSLFEQTQRNKVVCVLLATIGMAMALGDIFGGLCVSYHHWQWIFSLNVLVGLSAMSMAFIFLSQRKKNKKKSIHWLKTAALLANKSLFSVIFIGVVVQAIFFVLLFIMSLYLENILNFSAIKAGCCLFSIAFMIIIIASVSRGLIHYFSLRFLVFCSCFILALAMVFLMNASLLHSTFYVILALILLGTAYAIHFYVTKLAIISMAAVNKAAFINNLLFTIAFLSAAMGIVMACYLLKYLSDDRINNVLTFETIELTPTQNSIAHNIASGAQSITDLFQLLPYNLARLVHHIIIEGFIYSFNWIVTIFLILAFVGMAMAIFTLKNIRIKRDNVSEPLLAE